MVQSKLKLKGTPTSALLGATIGFFFGVMAISLFGPTSTTLGAAMGLGATELGLLVSVPSLTVPASHTLRSDGRQQRWTPRFPLPAHCRRHRLRSAESAVHTISRGDTWKHERTLSGSVAARLSGWLWHRHVLGGSLTVQLLV